MRKYKLMSQIVLLVSLVVCGQSFASTTFVDEPLPHVTVLKQAANYLELAADSAKKAGLNLELGQTEGEVRAMLNARKFDSVYRVIMGDKFRFSHGLKLANRYCLEMAAAGHADELKQQLPNFKDKLFVKSTLDRHARLTVETLFKRPMLSGMAIFEARNGNLDLAVEHLKAIKELPCKKFYLFVDECVEEVGCRLLFDRMDAECAELVSLFCGDNPKEAANIIRGIFAGRALYVTVEFLKALPVAYHPAAQREIHFLLDNSRVSKEQKVACLEWAFESLQPAKDNTVLQLRYEAIRQGVLPADSLKDSLPQFYEIPSNERGKLLVTQRPLAEELLRIGDVSEANRVLLHAGDNVDPSIVTRVARRNFQLGLMKEGLQVLDLKIQPTKMRGRRPIPELLPLLLEGKAFDEAEAYAKFLGEKKSVPEGFANSIIELYQTLDKPVDSTQEQLKADVHQAIDGISKSDAYTFNRVANVPRFAASLVCAHGPRIAYEIANNELQTLFSNGFPVGETIAVLLLDGKNDEAIEFSKCWKPDDKLSFSETVNVTSPEFYDLDFDSKVFIEIVEAFGDILKYDTFFQRAQIRNAVKREHKYVAFKVVQQAILDEPEFYLSGWFIEHGWDQDLISCVTELEKKHPQLRGLTERTRETLANNFFDAGKHDQATEYVQKISRHRKRVELFVYFAELLLEMKGNVTEPTEWIDKE